VSYGDSLHCLDASTGDTKWTRTDVDVSYGLYVFGDEVYFGTEGERHGRGEYRDSDISTIYCLDAHTGKQILNYTINGDPRYMVMVDDILYVGASYPYVYSVPETGYVYALKLTIEPIPEFPSWTILLLVLTITLFSIVVKRKLKKNASSTEMKLS
jgi:outer membrane protein assembly factor BamB